ncbi:MAG: hypothetical protein NTV89_16155 [Proteobacteria bacterium]|nr:hypothetical protein [Pseudomonadota bacterium]
MLERLCYHFGMTEDKKKKDINELAFSIVSTATGETKPEEPISIKNPAAVSLGRLGGLKGGKARAAILNPEKRKEIARNAARKRWDKTNNK